MATYRYGTDHPDKHVVAAASALDDWFATRSPAHTPDEQDPEWERYRRLYYLMSVDQCEELRQFTARVGDG